MSYIEKWKKRKEEEKEINNRRQAREKKIEEAQTKEILSVLSQHGIQEKEVSINSYWFHFIYSPLYINFVNQNERLCGEMYRILVNKDEEECIRDGHTIMHKYPKERKEFQKEFNYRNFIFYGHPRLTTENVITLAQLPLEDVIKLQNSRTGVIHLEENRDLKDQLEYLNKLEKGKKQKGKIINLF